MCPLRLIPRIFSFDEEEVAPEHRAQRTINRVRIPEITNYILDYPNDYVFSSLTASVDGCMNFTPFSLEPQFKDIGRLTISLDARFLINDGQHRRAAILEALKINPDLGSESISVVFYADTGLTRSQQMFADLNRHAVNTTSSLGILYDHRDHLATVTKEIVSEIPLLRQYTDMEKQNLSQLSPRLFSLSTIFNTNCKILNKKKGQAINDQERDFLKKFWCELASSMNEWQRVFRKELAPNKLRTTSISTTAVFLEAIGVVANYLYLNHPDDWPNYVQRLSKIDCSRNECSDWYGRAYTSTGRIVKNRDSIQSTANLIKIKIGLPLSEKELLVEDKLKVGVSNA